MDHKPWYLSHRVTKTYYSKYLAGKFSNLEPIRYTFIGSYGGKLKKGEYAAKDYIKEIQSNIRFEFVENKNLVFYDRIDNKYVLSDKIIRITTEKGEDIKPKQRYTNVRELRP